MATYLITLSNWTRASGPRPHTPTRPLVKIMTARQELSIPPLLTFERWPWSPTRPPGGEPLLVCARVQGVEAGAGAGQPHRRIVVQLMSKTALTFYPQIAVAYAQIATASTDTHHESQEFRASVGAQWPFLSDPGRIVQKDLDIQEYTDPEHDPMIPHTLVLKPGLVIHKIYTGYWFWGRPSVEDLRQDLRAVTREIRPDWDLSTPGLREAWDAGDFSHFHGWDRKAGANA